MRTIFLLLTLLLTSVSAAADKRSERILSTMKRATRYMMDVASYRGGFVWSYLPDGSRQWGEMEAYRTMAWIQPPGTPAVGHLMLDAYHATGDEYYYACAERIANALIWGQLPCGGWNYMFDFAGEGSMRQWYATIGRSGWRLEEFQHYYGNATFDDVGTIQAAKFLLRLYVEKNDPAYRAPLDKAIDFVLQSQYPIGGWPQRWPLRYDHVFHGKADYSSFITLNDDVIPENIDFLVQCYQALGMTSLKEPIMRALNLSIVLQQGEPYAGWADQYTVEDLQPAHARSYEPRSVNTGTTAHMIHKMIDYYRLTGETKFLSGIPAALRFLESQALPAAEVERWSRNNNGRPLREGTILVPRFIDPDDGKPLYVHRVGSNAGNGHYYTDQQIENTIAHYSSVATIDVGALREAYQAAAALSRDEAVKDSPLLQTRLIPLDKYYYRPRPAGFGGGRGPWREPSLDEVIDALHPDGYWLSPLSQVSNPYEPMPDDQPASTSTEYSRTMVGDRYDTSPYNNSEVQGISTRTFITNMTRLLHAAAGE